MTAATTIIIKTFGRYGVLRALLASIASSGLRCPVIIADDSARPYRAEIMAEFGALVEEYVILPFDVGLSAGRNELVRRVKTPYFALFDDDFLCDHRTRIDRMRRILEDNELELLGGLCLNRPELVDAGPREMLRSAAQLRVRITLKIALWLLYQHRRLRAAIPYFRWETPWYFWGHFLIDDTICYLDQMADSAYQSPFTRCDYVPNFFVASTEAVRRKNVFWDEELKFYGEHLDYFFRAKRSGLKVAVTLEAAVAHQRIVSGYHARESDDRALMLKKNGLDEIRIVPCVAQLRQEETVSRPGYRPSERTDVSRLKQPKSP